MSSDIKVPDTGSTIIESETAEYSEMNMLRCDESRPNRKHCLHDLLNQIIGKLNDIDKRLSSVRYHTQTIKLTYTKQDDVEDNGGNGDNE